MMIILKTIKHRQKIILATLIIIAPLLIYGQKQGNIWYFGDHVGLDFNYGNPIVLINGATYFSNNHSEGTAVISDSFGSLLFYTNGRKIWNRNHQLMPNGDSLLGHWSSTQSSIIIPQPQSSRYFYVFTTDAFFEDNLQYGFRYSIVDICLDNGLGDIIKEKENIKLLDTVAEKLTAVRHANGIDYWVITHKYFSDAFYSYHLSSTGIIDTVISHIGSFHPTGNQALGASIGQLKASPNGHKLAIVNGNSNNSIAEYFDFNASTGVVSNCVNIQTDSLYNYYGVSFSPDNSKLYIACWLNNNVIYQFNLNAGGGNPDSVFASKVSIATIHGFNGLQLAPDGKIYVTPFFGNYYLSVINDPNLSGLNCNYLDSVIYLNGFLAGTGLPNFIDSYDYSNTTYDCLNGIEEQTKSLEINIYPNPVSDYLTIYVPTITTIEILNIEGQIIKTIIHDNGETSVDIRDLSSGVYIVRASTDKEIVTKKFIKQ